MDDLQQRLRTITRQDDRSDNWYSVVANKAMGSKARVDLFDEVGVFGKTAKEFATEITALDVKEIELHLNSPGGEVFDGIAIMNTLRDHPAKVTVIVDGVAASSASFIAMAGDTVIMNRHAELMIHEAFGMAVGSAVDMRDLAGRLDKVSDSIAEIYANRAGGTVAEWRDAMRAETWYSAQEAVDVGLADRVATKAEPAVKNRFDLSIFNYAGRSAAPPPPKHDTETPAASASGPTEYEKEQDMGSLMDSLRQRLGIADQNADEGTLLAALDEALAERADPPQPQEIKNTADLPKDAPQDLAKAANAAGAVVLDRGVWEQAQAQIQEGVAASRKLREQERDTILAKAVEDGRIPPANKDYWANLYDRDPKGTADVINSLKRNLVPVSATGYSNYDEGTDPLDEFSHLFPATGKGR